MRYKTFVNGKYCRTINVIIQLKTIIVFLSNYFSHKKYIDPKLHFLHFKILSKKKEVSHIKCHSLKKEKLLLSLKT